MNSTRGKVEIKQLDSADVESMQQLIRLFNEVFETKDPSVPKKLYLKKLLKKPEFIVFVAIQKNEVLGGLTAYELPMYHTKSSEIFIYDIAVKTEFQRKGLGKKLLSAIKKYGKQNGIKELFVPANEEDIHALEFYRSTGGKPEKVIHFNYSSSK